MFTDFNQMKRWGGGEKIDGHCYTYNDDLSLISGPNQAYIHGYNKTGLPVIL
jgi:hypothetical protein